METKPIVLTCHDFVNGGGTKEKKTAVVVPIKTEEQGSVQRISWTCSRGAVLLRLNVQVLGDGEEQMKGEVDRYGGGS